MKRNLAFEIGNRSPMKSIQDYCKNVECHCLVEEILLAEFVHGDMHENFVKQYVVQLSNLTSEEMKFLMKNLRRCKNFNSNFDKI